MKEVSVLGIDLAKSIFQFCGVDEHGKEVLSKKVRRGKVVETVAKLAPDLIGLEACPGSNYWARTFRKLGFEVRIVAPQFVKPYVKSQKNDAHDAQAIVEAILPTPHMRFVLIKEVSHQDIQCIHRVRSRLIRNRTKLSNSIRGLLAEYGLVFAIKMPPGQETTAHLKTLRTNSPIEVGVYFKIFCMSSMT